MMCILWLFGGGLSLASFLTSGYFNWFFSGGSTFFGRSGFLGVGLSKCLPSSAIGVVFTTVLLLMQKFEGEICACNGGLLYEMEKELQPKRVARQKKKDSKF